MAVLVLGEKGRILKEEETEAVYVAVLAAAVAGRVTVHIFCVDVGAGEDQSLDHA